MRDQSSTVSRRSLFAGAATVGAVAAVSSVLPGVIQKQLPTTPSTALQSTPILWRSKMPRAIWLRHRD